MLRRSRDWAVPSSPRGLALFAAVALLLLLPEFLNRSRRLLAQPFGDCGFGSPAFAQVLREPSCFTIEIVHADRQFEPER